IRYGTGHKQATRQRIVEAAGRLFKEDGIDGAGVAAVMSDAGLTNGAFYGHFTSKEDLVANVLADQLHTQPDLRLPGPRSGGTRSVHPRLPVPAAPRPVRRRLPVRRPAATRQVFTDELMGVIDDIAARLDPTDAEAARTDALTILGLMIGAPPSSPERSPTGTCRISSSPAAGRRPGGCWRTGHDRMQTARLATHAHKATTTARRGAPNAIAAGIPNKTADACQPSMTDMFVSSWRSPVAGARSSSRAIWSPLSAMASAAVFSSMRETRLVPGMGAVSSPLREQPGEGDLRRCGVELGWLPRHATSWRENGPDPRPAAVAVATGERYVIRLSLRICLSKIREGTRRRSMPMRPAAEPAG